MECAGRRDLLGYKHLSEPGKFRHGKAVICGDHRAESRMMDDR
jgi:hypothetical protein